ncbi:MULTISPECIES: polyhydroxyalkanoate synthesis repressor PhaR [unclassified Brevundimonas]|uniref:polyhydroxyalkanoate synthesis repressor PhaR n=2 Tax=unclassified Brevundimonas TaxID=2622653 RepID=UPI0025C67F84|nr:MULTISPECIES: polyhydroxyalkanoate synthesis repressor PhaR [unclassified Brevundimonas]
MGTVVIKKYANRRLYNTASSSYVTLDDLAHMVRQGVEFVVYDAKTNDDLTRQILTQIIFEQENRGEALLPVQFLRQLIGFYGDKMQAVLPSYLEMSLDHFTRQQDELRQQFTRAFAQTPGGSLMEEAARQNMAMFERAMRMFPAFGYGAAQTPSEPQAKTEAEPAAADDLTEMKKQMEAMRAQLDRLSKASGQ